MKVFWGSVGVVVPGYCELSYDSSAIVYAHEDVPILPYCATLTPGTNRLALR